MKCTSTMMWERGQHGTTAPLMPGYGTKDKQHILRGKGKRKKKWTGWKPKTDEQTIEFKKGDGEKRWYWRWSCYFSEDYWDCRRWGGASHKSRKRKFEWVHLRMLGYVRKQLQGAQQRSREKCSRNKPGKPERNTWRNAAWNWWRGKTTRKPRWLNCMWKGISQSTEKNGKRKYRGTVKKYTLIWRKQIQCEKQKWILQKRKVISNLQWTDAMQKSQLTWCCKPRPNWATTRSTDQKTQ